MNHQTGAIAAGPKTIQGYIDETPYWRDGTEVATQPLAPMQVLIWVLASAGKLFEGMIVFMTGVTLPLLAADFELTAVGHGLVSAAPLFGILVGASLLGGLSDRLGRRTMFITEGVIFIIFVTLTCISPNWLWLLACLFGIGLALGCDYPTAHVILTETVPSRWRGRLILSAFAFQAVGALCGTLVGYLILSNIPDVSAWRWMYAAVIVPGIVIAALRFIVVESPHWLLMKGRDAQAKAALLRLLKRVPRYPSAVSFTDPRTEPATSEASPQAGLFSALFAQNARRATILASVPWFLQDLGTYGIGMFTPIILASSFGIRQEHATTISQVIHNDILAARGAAIIDVFLIVGILFAIFLSDRVGRIRLQVLGFIGCALGLALAGLSSFLIGPSQIVLLFVAFMLFNFMTNLGPNAQTYLIAGEVFPTAIRGRGAGFAASFAKIGAVTTAFLFPILLADIGTPALLAILVGTSLAGAAVTYAFRIETARRNLEEDVQPHPRATGLRSAGESGLTRRRPQPKPGETRKERSFA